MRQITLGNLTNLTSRKVRIPNSDIERIKTLENITGTIFRIRNKLYYLQNFNADDNILIVTRKKN